jgi:hypothetical protein
MVTFVALYYRSAASVHGLANSRPEFQISTAPQMRMTTHATAAAAAIFHFNCLAAATPTAIATSRATHRIEPMVGSYRGDEAVRRSLLKVRRRRKKRIQQSIYLGDHAHRFPLLRPGQLVGCG